MGGRKEEDLGQGTPVKVENNKVEDENEGGKMRIIEGKDLDFVWKIVR